MTKARENSDYTGLAADITAGDTAARAGRKNLIINGGMQVSQRGAYTITTTGGPEYGGPDRFHMWSYASSEQVTAEISKSTVGGTPTGFANTYRIDVLTAESSVAAGESLVFAQYIEAQNCQHLEYGTSDAKSVTLSFWIKTSVTGTYCFFLQNSDGDRIQVKEYTVNSADTWEKKIITIPGDASGTINNDNGRGLWCGWVLMAGTDRHGSKDAWRTTGADYATSSQVNAVHSTANNIYFTGVQLEVGDTATAYEHLSYAEELSACQRYFQKSKSGTPTQNSFGGHQISVASGRDPQSGAAFGGGFSSDARAFGQSSRQFILDNTDVGASTNGWAEIGWTSESEL